MFFKKPNLVAVLYFVLAILFVTTSADAGPTKKETIDFITNKTVLNVPEAWRGSKGDEGINTALTSNEDMCVLTYTTKFYDKANNLLHTEIEEVDLRNVNPNKLNYAKASNLTFNFYNINFGLVMVETKEKKPLISYKKIVTEHGKATSEYRIDKTTNNSLLQIITADYDSAQRVVKALRHLVTLCGGKDELF